MKDLTRIVFVGIVFLAGCAKTNSPQDHHVVWKDNPPILFSDEEVKSEISQKMIQVQIFLKAHHLDGILLTQVRNVHWITAGLANSQIVLNKDVGAASLLIMNDGSKYVICNGSEAGRLMDEVLGKLGYVLKQYNWFEANKEKDVRGELIKEISHNGRIGSDIDYPATVFIGDNFRKLRYSLTETEIKRYRWLGRQTTEAVEEVCRNVKQGMNEYQIEAITASSLRSRGIMPTVLLIAVDDRIFKYRHALAGGATLQHYAMINVVAEKWGMPIAVTRFVHFGPLPAELETKLQKTARVNAQFELATVPGTACADIFERCKVWYAEAGYPDEWKKHHQGGAIGYDDREFVIYPGIQETVQENQAFAWNPTITGAKVEDTIIAFKDRIEVVTRSDGWPMIKIEINGKIYEQPGILIR
ncbi:MAG: M24 family metallopeptidase [Ignavibacteriales bacterium]|nr:M24 family metallopeptidase [Ignavibacteriales bacterium]